MQYYNLHTHHFTDQDNVLELVNQYPDTFDESVPAWSIGIHPWRIDQERIDSDFRILESRLADKSCYAIGECGLDKRIEIPLKKQLVVFEKQVLLAEHYKKPVIIHCVAAFQEIIEIKKKLNVSVPMVIHGFSKNLQVAESLVKNGFHISFGKYLLRNPELERVFSFIPNDRIFLETDTIEEGIEEVYAVALKYKDISLAELEKIIESNFNLVFGGNE